MTGSEGSEGDSAGPGRRAASVAAGWCGRELGAPYAALAWQLLADAARLGLMRHGRPEAWAAGAIVLVASANGLVHPGGESVSAQLVADDLGVSLGALASTERELARVLNLARYRYRLPHSADGERTPAAAPSSRRPGGNRAWHQ